MFEETRRCKFVKPKSIEDYCNRLRKYNKTLLSYLNEAYDTLHLAGYYRGTPFGEND
ncbi:DUF5618 family protein [Dyadobacter chenwenxiniae]|uniref:DUF5618 family protein n=1 Tax=Dyadobacter chenwenxiniae TaxID=2906456 RepID=UPI0035B596EB